MFIQPEKQLHSPKDIIFSDFPDPEGNLIPINEHQAVITVTAKKGEMMGRHSTLILEYVGDEGLARTNIFELNAGGPNNNLRLKIRLRQRELKPGPDSPVQKPIIKGDLPQPSMFASHIITGVSAKRVLNYARNFKTDINQKYFYSLFPMGSNAKNLSPLNCTGFSNMLLRKAGVNKKGFLESFIPSHLVGKGSTMAENNKRLGKK